MAVEPVPRGHCRSFFPVQYSNSRPFLSMYIRQKWTFSSLLGTHCCTRTLGVALNKSKPILSSSALLLIFKILSTGNLYSHLSDLTTGFNRTGYLTFPSTSSRSSLDSAIYDSGTGNPCL